MKTGIVQFKNHILYRTLSSLMTVAFTFSCVVTPANAQVMLAMPAPGTMVKPSTHFAPPMIKGLEINLQNPLEFDFLIDQCDNLVATDKKQEEYTKLIKYFLAALTLPEKDMWVNLSPYEQDRIIPDNFGQTEMGRDLLSQDYILKQLTASIIYPEEELGQKFWERVQKRALELYGKIDVPVNTFNKVWIVPDQVIVYEKGHTAWILTSHLKVMLEQDYQSMMKNMNNQLLGTDKLGEGQIQELTAAAAQVVREVVIPEIEKEVNEGQHFALLRQIYQSMILATWYKKALKESLLAKVYADKSKVLGVQLDDPAVNQQIYEQYLEAFKKGVYNYIKEDYDPVTQELIPRKYFSGGFAPEIDQAMRVVKNKTEIDSLPTETRRTIRDSVARMSAPNRLERANGFFRQFGADDYAMINDQKKRADAILREGKIQRWSRMLALPEQEVLQQLKSYDEQYQEIESRFKGMSEFSTHYKALIRQTMQSFRKWFAQHYGLHENNVAFIFSGSMGKGTVRAESADIDMDIVIMDSLSREELKITPEEWAKLSAEQLPAITRAEIQRIHDNLRDFMLFMSDFFGKTVSNEVAMHMKSTSEMVEIILESELHEIGVKSHNLAEPAAETGNMFKRFLWRDIVGSEDAPELPVALENIMTSERNKPAVRERILTDLKTKANVEKREAKIDSRYYRIKEALGLYESFLEYMMTEPERSIMLANKRPGDEEDYGTVAYALRKTADRLVELGVIEKASDFTRGYENLFAQIHQPSNDVFSLVNSPDVQNLLAIIDKLGILKPAAPKAPEMARPEQTNPAIAAAREVFMELSDTVKQEISVRSSYMPTTTQVSTEERTVFQILDNAGSPILELTNLVREEQAVIEVKTLADNSDLVETALGRVIQKLNIKTDIAREKIAGILNTAFYLRIGPVSDMATARGRTWNTGGIDFNSTLMNMQIKRDKNGVPLPVEFQDIGNIRVNGFVPVIINITPVTSGVPALSEIMSDSTPST